MFYGVYGDSDGDTPQVIGEASWLMARTCFPDEDLNGNNGHTEADVTCEPRKSLSLITMLTFLDILFTGSDSVLPTSALNENYITNFSTLRVMGDKLMTALAKNLNLRPGSPTTTTSASGSSPTGMTISWERQCLGKTLSVPFILALYRVIF